MCHRLKSIVQPSFTKEHVGTGRVFCDINAGLRQTTRDGTMADFDGICKSAGYWRPSVCSAWSPDSDQAVQKGDCA